MGTQHIMMLHIWLWMGTHSATFIQVFFLARCMYVEGRRNITADNNPVPKEEIWNLFPEQYNSAHLWLSPSPTHIHLGPLDRVPFQPECDHKLQGNRMLLLSVVWIWCTCCVIDTDRIVFPPKDEEGVPFLRRGCHSSRSCTVLSLLITAHWRNVSNSP
ncbi:hypothetical protein QBC43DRAFT_17832 [Cladorrhinum sp. PSN259]|nr:hypothetical protein QBC43DRAFT_17832 [Cladorrhinum sp. PSN259]